MLDATLKTQLAGYLESLGRPVELCACLDASQTATELRALLNEVVALSPLLTMNVVAAAEGMRCPSFTVAAAGEPARVAFAGLPLGHEFTSFVLALLQAGGRPPKAGPEQLRDVAALDRPLVFETYVSLSCQNCPDVVQALNLMAAVNPNVRHTMIEGSVYEDEVRARGILAVPAVYLNGEPFAQGRLTLKDILGKLGPVRPAAGVTPKAAVAPYDVLIVGGGPAGAAAAIYAARKGLRTGIAAERFGGQLQDTLGIENFVSVQATEGPKLAHALENHVLSHEVDLHAGVRATSLAAGDLLTVSLDDGAVLTSRSVILATGARWREMRVPGESEYRNRGVAYCPHCDGPLFRAKRVAVIGGGNSGAEAAIDLAGLASHVTLLEYDATLRADAVLQRKLGSLPNVTVLTSAETLEVTGDGSRVTGLRYRERTTGREHALDLAGIFVQIGLVPNTEWLPEAIERTARGEIVTGAHGETSLPGVFAAGDCTTVPYKQIVIAVGDGARAALGAFDHLIRLPVADQSADQAMDKATAAAA